MLKLENVYIGISIQFWPHWAFIAFSSFECGYSSLQCAVYPLIQFMILFQCFSYKESQLILETVFLFTGLIYDICSSGWIVVMLTSTLFSSCHLSSTSWVPFTVLSSGCGDKAYYHSFDSSLFIMPRDSWKMRDDSARWDFKIIVTIPYYFWIVQEFLEMQMCWALMGKKKGHWR